MNRNEKISTTLRRADFPVGTPFAEDDLIHRSKRKGVVNRVHELCHEMIKQKGKTRKDVLARCRKLGIAEHTARTQYDRWRNPPKKTKKAKKEK